MSDTPVPDPLDPHSLEHAASADAPLDCEDGDIASPLADAAQATGNGAAHDDDELPDVGDDPAATRLDPAIAEPLPLVKRDPAAGREIDVHKIWVTIFDDEFAQTERHGELTLPVLAKAIRETTAPAEGQLPGLKLAKFGATRSDKGCLRSDANVLAISGVEGEHDAGTVPFDEAVAIMRKAGVRCIVYTSPIYIPEAKERWRILLPLSEPRKRSVREKFIARVNGLFDGKLAGESFTLSQACYFGSVDNDPNHRVEVIDGEFLDRCDRTYAGSIFKDGSRVGDHASGSHTQTRTASTAGTKERVSPPPPIDDNDNDPTMPLDAKATGNTPVDDASPVDAPHSNVKSHPPSDKPEELIPDRDVLVRFVDVMFRNARRDGFVSLRAFEDNGRGEKPILIEPLRLDDYQFIPMMLERTRQAANWWKPAVFCPPVATFKDHRNAKTDNIREGVALSTECDQSPAEARATLEALLGPATVVVESGGEWMNGETGEIEPKVHLHWRLKKPAATLEELAALYEARSLATRLVGGDRTNISIVHPIRWPGSWHRKRTPRLARIVALAENTEIDLGEALERLRAEVGVIEPVSVTSISGRREASDHSAVASALAAIPNGADPKAHDWEYWNKIGMTIWASTDGSEAGRLAFHEWSAKSKRNDPTTTEARWQHYFRSPPTRLGFGSLVYQARLHVPGWRYENPESAAATAAVGEIIARMLRERDEPDEAEEKAGGGASGVSPITATPYEWIEPADITPRDWLYGRLLVRKFVTATVAPGGLGKSSLIAAEAVAQVSGMNLIGVTPKERLRVWLFNLEDPQEETQRKIQAVAKHYGLGREAIGDRLFVDSGRDQSLVIAKMTREGPMIVRPVVDALVKEIIDKQIDVLIIDPFVSCHEVPENDNTAQDMVVKEWGKVAELGNCAVHLVDHTRKMGSSEAEVTTETARGAKAKTDACRVVRAVSRMTKEEGEKAGVENHRLHFRTYNDKANLAPPADRSDWFKLESVDLGNGAPFDLGGGETGRVAGDSVGVVTQWKWPDAMAGVTDADFKMVAAEIRTGEWRKDVQAGDWVGKPVAKALKLNLNDKADKAKVAGMIRVWLGRGLLVEVSKPDKQRRVKTFAEVAEEV